VADQEGGRHVRARFLQVLQDVTHYVKVEYVCHIEDLDGKREIRGL
jgi:hypothetical protein